MKRKIFRAPFELKQGEDEQGQFTAAFATFNVKDHDGDVTPPGAFEDGQEVIVEPWNHGWNLPVGKGIIRQDEDKAWVEGEFFLNTDVGLNHYTTVKNMGGLQEWSYTFDVLESTEDRFNGERVRILSKMDVVGVSPVTRGAGINTRTMAIKEKGGGDEPVEGDEITDEGDKGGGHGEVGEPNKPRGIDVLLTQIEIIEIEAGLPEAELPTGV